MGVDGLVLYDVDAESDRTTTPRPFPFLPMMDPVHFLESLTNRRVEIEASVDLAREVRRLLD